MCAEYLPVGRRVAVATTVGRFVARHFDGAHRRPGRIAGLEPPGFRMVVVDETAAGSGLPLDVTVTIPGDVLSISVSEKNSFTVPRTRTASPTATDWTRLLTGLEDDVW
jgi:hypothetical protein